MNTIILEFANRTITHITGKQFGSDIFNKQVAPKIKWEEMNTIVFPNTIEGISISFMQGFADEMIKKYGRYNVRKKINFEASSEYLKNRIIENIEF